MRKLVVLTGMIFVLAGTSTAQAHWFNHPSSKQAAKVQLKLANLTIMHSGYAIRAAKSVIRYVKANKDTTIRNPDPYKKLIATSRLAKAERNLKAHIWLRAYGEKNRQQALDRLQPSKMEVAWAWYNSSETQCVVNKEGGWTSVNSAGYYGRFQMDISFQKETPFGYSMYKKYGTADRWPHWAQVYHAWEVWVYAGWSRWPTHDGCG